MTRFAIVAAVLLALCGCNLRTVYEWQLQQHYEHTHCPLPGTDQNQPCPSR